MQYMYLYVLQQLASLTVISESVLSPTPLIVTIHLMNDPTTCGDHYHSASLLALQYFMLSIPTWQCLEVTTL